MSTKVHRPKTESPRHLSNTQTLRTTNNNKMTISTRPLRQQQSQDLFSEISFNDTSQRGAYKGDRYSRRNSDSDNERV